jgi:hypothetical protein
VLYGGRLMGIVPAASADREQLGLMMAGIHDDEPGVAHG